MDNDAIVQLLKSYCPKPDYIVITPIQHIKLLWLNGRKTEALHKLDEFIDDIRRNGTLVYDGNDNVKGTSFLDEKELEKMRDGILGSLK